MISINGTCFNVKPVNSRHLLFKRLQPCFHGAIWFSPVGFVTLWDGYFCVSIVKSCGWYRKNCLYRPEVFVTQLSTNVDSKHCRTFDYAVSRAVMSSTGSQSVS